MAGSVAAATSVAGGGSVAGGSVVAGAVVGGGDVSGDVSAAVSDLVVGADVAGVELSSSDDDEHAAASTTRANAVAACRHSSHRQKLASRSERWS